MWGHLQDAELPYAFALTVGSLTGLERRASAPLQLLLLLLPRARSRWSGGRDFLKLHLQSGIVLLHPVKIHPNSLPRWTRLCLVATLCTRELRHGDAGGSTTEWEVGQVRTSS